MALTPPPPPTHTHTLAQAASAKGRQEVSRELWRPLRGGGAPVAAATGPDEGGVAGAPAGVVAEATAGAARATDAEQGAQLQPQHQQEWQQGSLEEPCALPDQLALAQQALALLAGTDNGPGAEAARRPVMRRKWVASLPACGLMQQLLCAAACAATRGAGL